LTGFALGHFDMNGYSISFNQIPTDIQARSLSMVNGQKSTVNKTNTGQKRTAKQPTKAKREACQWSTVKSQQSNANSQ